MHYLILLAVFLPMSILGTSVRQYGDYSLQQPHTVKTELGNVTFHPPVHSSVKRKSPQPLHCMWPVGTGLGYYWVEATMATGTACFGFVSNSICSGWNGQDLADIQASMAEQVTKNGPFEMTQVRNWLASFYWPPTTAFDDRNTQIFNLAVTRATAGLYGSAGVDAGTYLWSRNGNLASTTYSVSVWDMCK